MSEIETQDEFFARMSIEVSKAASTRAFEVLHTLMPSDVYYIEQITAVATDGLGHAHQACADAQRQIEDIKAATRRAAEPKEGGE